MGENVIEKEVYRSSTEELSIKFDGERFAIVQKNLNPESKPDTRVIILSPNEAVEFVSSLVNLITKAGKV